MNRKIDKVYNNFEKSMKNLSIDEQGQFLQLIADNWLEDNEEDVRTSLGESKLMTIAAYLAERTDTISVRLHRGSKENDALLVDEFLYNDKALNHLRRENKFVDFYCKDCGSSSIKQFELLSPSCSIARLEALFGLLSGWILETTTVVDVGSGLGAVLFGAYVLSPAARIIGVEINAAQARLSQRVIEKFHMNDRIAVVTADFTTQPQLIKRGDVVIVSNIFEHLSSRAMGVRGWRFLYRHIRPGALLVITPSPQVEFAKYPIGVKWHEWLNVLYLSGAEGNPTEDLFSCTALCLVVANKPNLPRFYPKAELITLLLLVLIVVMVAVATQQSLATMLTLFPLLLIMCAGYWKYALYYYYE